MTRPLPPLTLLGLFLLSLSACSGTSASGTGGSLLYILDGSADGATDAAPDGAILPNGSGCHGDADCKVSSGFEACARVEDPQCGGAAPQQTCEQDTDCADAGADAICIASTCGERRCGPKCTSDADCPSAESELGCGANGHCGAKACSSSTQCPTNYLCASGSCILKQCKSDGECTGACVNGECSSAIGVCREPAA